MHVRDPFPDVFGQTVHDLMSALPTAGFLNFRMRLDHIFAGPGLDVARLRGHASRTASTTGQWHELSDHVPIVGRFKIKSASVAI